MNAILYVYDTAGLSDLRNELNDYKFYSIAHFEAAPYAGRAVSMTPGADQM